MENYAGIEQKLVYTIISNRNTATVKIVGVWRWVDEWMSDGGVVDVIDRVARF